MANSRAEDIEVLNRFLYLAWGGISDILHGEVSHQAAKEVASLPGPPRQNKTWMHLTVPPGVRANLEDGLLLEMPRSGVHRYLTQIRLLRWLPFPAIDLDVEFAARMEVAARSRPELQVETGVYSNRIGDLLDRVAGWKSKVMRNFSGPGIEEELGYFATVRYDPDSIDDLPEPVLVNPARPRMKPAINLVFVPESFSHDLLARFDHTIETIVSTFASPVEARANEPYHSLRSAFTFWTIKPEQDPDGDHVMGSFTDPRGHRRVALGNMARLAALFRRAGEVVDGPTVLVLIVNPDAPRFDGRRPTAMALGNLVMQPLQETPEQDAWLLLHELGHTLLARLGDEYDLRSRREERYLGEPPIPPNLARTDDSAKWERWTSPEAHLPEWDQEPIRGFESGGYFGLGIMRPAPCCAMRSSREGIPFCAVCREALTLGIRRLLETDQLLLRIEHSNGDVEFRQVRAEQEPEETIVTLPDQQSSESMTITVLAGTLPEPWRLSSAITGRGHVTDTSDRPGNHESVPSETNVVVTPASGDRLTLRYESDCPFTPWDELPAIEFDLRFEAQD